MNSITLVLAVLRRGFDNRNMYRTPRTVLAIVASTLTLAMFGNTVADAKIAVVIGEIQVGSSTNTSAEYVLLANTTAQAVDVSNWRIQYKSASGVSWTTKATLRGAIDSAGTLLLASSAAAVSEPHQVMTDGLAQAGGHIQLIDGAGAVQDLVGWGTAKQPEGGSAAPAPGSGQLLVRKREPEGTYIDTNNNAADFTLPTVAPSPAPSPSPAPNPSPGPVNDLAPAIITELLPNPAAPQSDAADEFVELYNPNDQPLPLKGYKLQTGSSFAYSLLFDGETVPPYGYAIFTSAATPLSLANAAGAARLLDPAGQTVSQTDAYTSASEGQAWILVEDSWSWTTSPTPRAANVLTTPAQTTATTVVPPKAATKPASGQATPKPKTTTPAVKAAKTPKTATATDKKKAVSQTTTNSDTKNNPALHPLILAGVGASAVGYALYEYRHDLANLLHRLRRNRGGRRTFRRPTEGRGSH